MLILAGKKYAKNDAEFVDSLFESGGTCQGYYKRLKNGVQILDHQKQLRAFIVDRWADQFIVTATMKNGRAWYMNGCTSIDEEWLGIAGLSVLAEHEACRAALDSIANLHPQQ